MILAAAAITRWSAALDGWHEFFLMSGTAAVTLAGLLFVAISIHIDALVHESREHLLALARNILLSFTLVLVLSLMMLVPHATPNLTAFELLALGLVGAGVTVRQLRRTIADHPDFSRALLRWLHAAWERGRRLMGSAGAHRQDPPSGRGGREALRSTPRGWPSATKKADVG